MYWTHIIQGETTGWNKKYSCLAKYQTIEFCFIVKVFLGCEYLFIGLYFDTSTIHSNEVEIYQLEDRISFSNETNFAISWCLFFQMSLKSDAVYVDMSWSSEENRIHLRKPEKGPQKTIWLQNIC